MKTIYKKKAMFVAVIFITAFLAFSGMAMGTNGFLSNLFSGTAITAEAAGGPQDPGSTLNLRFSDLRNINPLNPVLNIVGDGTEVGSHGEFTLKSGKIYKFEVWGAEGGGGQTINPANYTRGGYGGYSVGWYDTRSKSETTAYYYLGGKGGDINVNPNGGLQGEGGYNGGGKGGTVTGTPINTSASSGGGGGGATDIRIGGQTITDRVIVAGGGGGGGGGSQQGKNATDGYGGDGGGVGSAGIRGFRVVVGGSGGLAGKNSTGIGDNGGNSTSIGDTHCGGGGGGGGGYYGGGGGGGGTNSASNTYVGGGGGGGSGYINGVSNLLDNDSNANSVAKTENGVNIGHGKIIITEYDLSDYLVYKDTAGFTAKVIRSGIAYNLDSGDVINVATVQTAVDAIKTDSSGYANSITFDGKNNGFDLSKIGTTEYIGTVLDIDNEIIEFDGWLGATLYGAINSQNSSQTFNIINGSTNINSYAYITNTGTGAVFNNTTSGSTNILGGTVSTNGVCAISSGGAVTVSGSGTTVSAAGSGNYAIYKNGAGALNITGGAQILSGGSGIYNASGNITITDSTITASGNYAVNNISSGTVTVSGSATTVTASGDYAVYNTGAGAVSITNGTLSAAKYAVYNNDVNAGLALSGTPVITGKLYAGIGKISVSSFTPGDNIYEIELSNATAINQIAVTNGSAYLANFKLITDNFSFENSYGLQVGTAPNAAHLTLKSEYHIKTAENLATFRDRVNAGTYDGRDVFLDNDIDLTDYLAGAGNNSGAGWMPIGNSTSRPFTGKFDGQGHKITGLWINRPSTDYIGLFGCAQNSTIQNLGVIIGGQGIIGQNYVGGLAGRLNTNSGNVSITNCYVRGLIIINGIRGGGFVGYLQFSTVGNITIERCGFIGTINITSTNTYPNTGGFVGEIAPWNGSTRTVIRNCYARGTINAPNAIGQVGGFLGIDAGPAASVVTSITNCYAAVSVNTNSSACGAFIGANSTNVSVSNCFYDTNVAVGKQAVGSGSASSGITGKTTSQMQTQGTFTGWNFTTEPIIWEIGSSGYPLILNHPEASILIKQEDLGVKLVADDIIGLTYKGSAHEPTPSLTYDGTELIEGTDFEYDSYSNNTNAGTNTASVTIKFKGNYSGEVTINFSIGKAALTISMTPQSNGTYGGSHPSFTFTGNNLKGSDTLAGLTYIVQNSQGQTVTLSASSPAGTYTIIPSWSNGNYNITLNNGTYIINKAAPTVTAPVTSDSKTYGTALSVWTLNSGWSWVDGSLVPTVTNSGYSAKLVISEADDNNYDYAAFALANSGYSYNATTRTLTRTGVAVTVTPATLTITATTGQTKVYGATDPTFAYTHSGLTNGDTASVITGALARAAGNNVGSAYAINQGTLSAGSNYTISFVGANFSITPATLTVTATAGQTKVYGAADPTFAYTATGWQYTDQTNQATILTGALTRAAGNNVGSTYAIQQGSLTVNGGNYTISFVGANFSITPATLTITARTGQTKVYGAVNPTYTYDVSGLTNGDTATVITGALARATGENVNTYAINQGTLSAGSNYTISFTGANFSITPATLTITATAGQTKVYGASDPTFAYTPSGLTNGDTASVITGALARAAGNGVGTYAINQGTLSAGSNYTISFTGANFSITPATLTVTVTAGQTKVYGASDPTFAYTHSGLTNGDTASVITGALARTAGNGVGTYAINQGTLSAGSNYTISFTGANFSITPATLTITARTGQTKVYGAVNPTYTYDVSGLTNGDTASVITGALARAAGENVNTYAINQGTLSAGSNYTISFVGANFSITPATLTITARTGQTKVYGAVNPTYTYDVSGLTNSDTATVITGALARAAGESVGSTYAIDQGNLSAGSNYTISFTGANFSITPATLTITVTAGQTKVYGASEPTFAFTTSGWQNGDTASIITGALSRATGSNVGTYAINQGNLSAGSNYTISFVGANFSITPATLTITARTGQTKVYGAVNPTYTYDVSGLTNSDTATVITGALARAAGESVGSTYAIDQGNLSAGSNYTISFTGANFSITPATLTITVTAGQTKVYGASEPTFAFTTSGWQNGDTASIITGALSRATGSNVGTYAINQGNLSAGSNYTISFVGANFSITPATLTVTVTTGQTKVYGAADPTFAYITSGWQYTDTAALVTGTLARATGNSVGTYAINQNDLSAGSNYTISFVGANFSITPATLTVTATANQTKVYGAADPAFTYTVTGWQYSDQSNQATILTGTLTRAAGNNVGSTYAIQQGNLTVNGGNYTISFVSANFSITPATLTVTVTTGQTKVYGAADPTFAYTASGWQYSDSVSLMSGALTRAVGNNVGSTYAISQGTLSAGSNYNISFVGANFSITPATLTVTVTAGQTKVYGLADPTFTYTTSGWQYTDSVSLMSGALTRATGSNVGTYAINQGDLSAGGNYTISFTGNNFSITPATLTITVTANQTKVYGATDPAFAYTNSGLTNGDTATVITGALSRAAGNNVGSYAINQNNLSAGSNYTISFVSANFSITPATLTVTVTAGQSKVYGAADPTFAYITSGWQYTDTIALISGALVRSAGESVDTYAINQGNISAGSNYTISFTGANFSITHADPDDPDYGDPLYTEPSLSAITYNPNITLADIELPEGWAWDNGSLTPTVGNSGYSATYYSSDSNYVSKTIIVTLTVNQLLLNKPTGKTVTFVYNGSQQSVALNGFDSSTMNISGNTGTIIGGYTAIITLKDTNNYGWTGGGTVSVNWSITQADPDDLLNPDPEYTEPSLGAITYDPNRTLADIVLPDGWAWDNGSLTPTVGNSGYSATYTPTDSNYAQKTIIVTLTVNQLLLNKPTGNTVSFIYNGSQQSVILNGFNSATMNISGNTGTAANGYTAVITLKDTTNYGWVGGGSVTINWTITKADPDDQTNPDSSYTEPSLSAITYDPNRKLSDITLPSGWTWDNDSITPTVGNSGYSATYTPADSNYSNKTITVTLTVNPLLLAKPTASGSTSLGFTGSEQTLGITGFDSATMNITGNKETAAGSYSAVITLKDTTNYGWIGGGSVTISWSIGKTDPSDPDYGDLLYTEPSLSAITYDPNRKLSDISLPSGWAWDNGNITPTVGNSGYSATYTPSDSNYASKTITVSLTVNPFLLAKPVLATNSYSYTGEVKTPSVTNYDSGLMTASGDMSATAAGGYNITVSLNDSTNYGWIGGGNTAVSLSWSIDKAQLAKPTLSANSFSYTGLEQSPSITGYNNSLMTASGDLSATNAGGYTITVSLNDTANYEWAGGGTADIPLTWSITKVKLAVTANDKSKTYGNDNPDLDYDITGFVNGENKSVISGAFSISTTATKTSSVRAGGYVITIENLDAWAANYDFYFVNGTLTINKVQLGKPALASNSFTYNGTARTPEINGYNDSLMTASGNLTATNANDYIITVSLNDTTNYEWADKSITPVSLDWSITKVILTVMANDKSKTYKDPNPTLDYSITGFVNGENKSVITGSFSITTTAGTNSPVIAGGYVIAIENLDAWAENYDFEFRNGTLTVNKIKVTKPVLITGFSLSYVYDGTAKTPLLGLFYDDLMEIAFGSDITATNAGDYTVIVSLKDTQNYEWADSTIVNIELDWSIEKAVLTVTANDQSKTYGNNNPELDYDISGFVNNEDKSVITGSFSITTTADKNSPVVAGGYVITIGNLDAWADNYDFEFVYGTLTVNKAELTKPTLDENSFVYTGLEQSPDITGYDSGLMTVTGDTSGTIVDSYSVTISLTDKTNYCWADGSDEDITRYWSITPKSATITADDITITYGDGEPTLTATVTGAVSGETLDYTITREPGTDAGTYIISITLGDNPNYNITVYSGTLRINAKSITIKADDQSKAYGEADDEFTYTITSGGLIDGDTITVTYTIAGATGTVSLGAGLPAGTYTITPEWTNGNYSITIVTGTYTVNRSTDVPQDTVTAPTTTDSYVYGTSLNNWILSDTNWEWEDGAEVPTVSNGGYYAVIRVDDSNYDYTGVEGYNPLTHTVRRLVAVDVLPDSSGLPSGTITTPTTSSSHSYGMELDNWILSNTDWIWENGAEIPTVNNGGYYAYISVNDVDYDYTGVQGYDPLTHTVRRLVAVVTVTKSTNLPGGTVTAPTTADTHTYGAELSDWILSGSGWSWVSGSLIPTVANDGYYAVISVDDGNYDYSGVEGYDSETHTLTMLVRSVTVAKRSITITAEDHERIYGQTEALSYSTSVSGVGSDLSNLTYEVRNSGGAVVTLGAATTVGVYTVYIVWSNENYDITLVAGTYTITKATPQPIDPQTFDDYTYGTALSDWDLTIGWYWVDGTITPTVGNGGYAVRHNIDTVNYDYTGVEGYTEGTTYLERTCTPTVTPREITITADDITITYGDGEPTLTATVTGAVSGETLDYTITREPGTDAGTYTIAVSLGSNPNYEITISDGLLTINKKAITIKADDNSKAYGEADPEFSYTITSGGLVDGDTINATYILAGAMGSTPPDGDIPAGSYTIMPEWSNSNYSITLLPGTYSVSKSSTPPSGTVTAPTAQDSHYYGTALENWDLSGTGWAWVDGTIVPTVTNTGYYAVISVDDENYDYTGVEGYNALTHTVTVLVAVVTVLPNTADIEDKINALPDPDDVAGLTDGQIADLEKEIADIEKEIEDNEADISDETQKKLDDLKEAIELEKEKREAIQELEDYVAALDESDYSSDSWEAIQEELTKGKEAINGADNLQDVADELQNAKDAIDDVPTKAEQTKDVEDKIGELPDPEDVKTLSNEDIEDLEKEIADLEKIIEDNGLDIDEDSQKKLDDLKDAIELEKEKRDAIQELEDYVAALDESDYTSDNWSAIQEELQKGKDAINDADTLQDVAGELGNAKDAIDDVPTKAEQTSEIEDKITDLHDPDDVKDLTNKEIADLEKEIEDLEKEIEDNGLVIDGELQEKLDDLKEAIELEKAKRDAIEELEAYVDALNESDYTGGNWDKIQEELQKGIDAINGADTLTGVADELQNAKDAIDDIPTIADQTAGVEDKISNLPDPDEVKDLSDDKLEELEEKIAEIEKEIEDNGLVIDEESQEKLDDLKDAIELEKAKRDAVEELQAYVDALNENDYTVDNWINIFKELQDGKDAINSADNLQEVADELKNAKDAIDDIPTKAEQKGEIENKIDALPEPDKIPELTDEQMSDLKKEIADIEKEIGDNGTDISEESQKKLDDLKDAIELEKAKRQAIKELEDYVAALDPDDYSAINWTEIQDELQKGKDSINDAETLQEVADELKNAKDAIDEVPTKADQTKDVEDKIGDLPDTDDVSGLNDEEIAGLEKEIADIEKEIEDNGLVIGEESEKKLDDLKEAIELEKAKRDAIEELIAYVDVLDESDYTADDWNDILEELQKGKDAINGAGSLQEVADELKNAKDAIDGVPTKNDQVGDIEDKIKDLTDPDEVKDLSDEDLSDLEKEIADIEKEIGDKGLVIDEESQKKLDDLKDAVELEKAKREAIEELEAYVSALDSNDYTAGNWNEVLDELQKGKDAINGADSLQEVADELKNAIDAIDGIPTKAERTGDVEDKIDKLPDPDDVKDLTDTEIADLEKEIADIEKEIEDDGLVIGEELQEKLDDLKGAIEKEKARRKALKGLEDYVDGLNPDNYTPENWDKIQDELQKGKNAINDAETLEDIAEELQNAIDAIDDIPTTAEQTGNIEDKITALPYPDEVKNLTDEQIADLEKEIADIEKEIADNGIVINEESQEKLDDLKDAINKEKARRKAIKDLQDYVDGLNLDDYSSDNWEAIQDELQKGIDAINDAETLEEIDGELSKAIDAIDDVPTIKEEQTKDIEEKIKNLPELDNIAELTDGEIEDLEKEIADIEKEIEDNGLDIDEESLKKLDDMKDAIELEKAKRDAIDELETYVKGLTESDYSTDNWSVIQDELQNGKDAINGAETFDDIADELQKAKDAIDGVLTKEEQTDEIEDRIKDMPEPDDLDKLTDKEITELEKEIADIEKEIEDNGLDISDGLKDKLDDLKEAIEKEKENRRKIIGVIVEGGTYTYDGKDKTVFIAGAMDDYTISYSIDGITYSTQRPDYKNVGIYTVHVRIEKEGYDAYNETVVITISKASASDIPKDITDTPNPGVKDYGSPLSGWELPGGWTWKDGNLVPGYGDNSYNAVIDVSEWDQNYDFSGVEGYDPDTHTIIRQIPIEVKVPEGKQNLFFILTLTLMLVIIALLILLCLFIRRKNKRDGKVMQEYFEKQSSDIFGNNGKGGEKNEND